MRLENRRSLAVLIGTVALGCAISCGGTTMLGSGWGASGRHGEDPGSNAYVPPPMGIIAPPPDDPTPPCTDCSLPDRDPNRPRAIRRATVDSASPSTSPGPSEHPQVERPRPPPEDSEGKEPGTFWIDPAPPGRVRQGDSFVVGVRISRAKLESLRAKIEALPPSTRTGAVAVAPTMKVSLDGHGFEISPHGMSEIQPVDGDRPAVWSWDVLAATSGKRTLTVTFSDATSGRTLESLPLGTIEVRSPSTWSAFVDPKVLFGGGGVVGFLALLWQILQKRKERSAPA